MACKGREVDLIDILREARIWSWQIGYVFSWLFNSADLQRDVSYRNRWGKTEADEDTMSCWIAIKLDLRIHCWCFRMCDIVTPLLPLLTSSPTKRHEVAVNKTNIDSSLVDSVAQGALLVIVVKKERSNFLVLQNVVIRKVGGKNFGHRPPIWCIVSSIMIQPPNCEKTRNCSMVLVIKLCEHLHTYDY